MAREYARVRVDIWVDDDIRALSPAAQHLYFVLLTSPKLSYCGVTDWRPGRIAALSRGWTVENVRAAAAELTQNLYIVPDEMTEEVMIRTFIRHDGLMKESRVAVSMVKAFAGVASNNIRGVIVHELRRLHESEPELHGWKNTKGEPGTALGLLDLTAIDPADLAPDLASGLGVGLAQTAPNVWGSVSGSTSPTPTPTPTPSTSNEVEDVPNTASAASPPREDVEALCTHLAQRMTSNGWKNATVTDAWRNAARLLIDRDSRPLPEAHALIDWCQESEFWKPNIKGMPKFRAQYDTLRLQAQAKGGIRLAAANGDRTWTAAELDSVLGPDMWRLPAPPKGMPGTDIWDWEQKTKAEHRAERVRLANEKLGRSA